MKSSISFLMPSHSKHPVGGFKVVYEYANRFVKDGYEVNILYPSRVSSKGESLLGKLKSFIRYHYYKFNKNYTPYHWFELDSKVKTLWVPSLAQQYMPETSIYVATSAQTAECLNEFTGINHKIYFIQGYEVWWSGEEYFLSTLDLPLRKIVISPHLLRVVETRGHTAVLIQNGFDFDYFKQLVDIRIRDKHNVAMLYHLAQAKGCGDGMKALQIVKKKFPLLSVSFFGYPEKPKSLPDWIYYHQAPNREEHNAIYNNAAIFIGTSYSEGWGLTVGEAMICGTAVACTNIDGYSIMAKHENTALLSEPGDYQSMAENIIRLIEDDGLREQIAQNGQVNIQKYKWDDSYLRFKTTAQNN